MKKKKLVNLGLSLLLAVSTLTGCGTKAAPKECAEVYCEMLYSSDISNIDKIGLTKEEAEEMLEESLDEGKEELVKLLDADGIEVDSEKRDQFFNSIMNLISKVEYTVEEESISGDTAKIKVKTQYIDIAALSERVSQEILPEFTKKEYASEEESKKAFIDMFIDKFLEELDNAPISTDTKEISYRFKKEDGIWLPQDVNEFGEKILDIVIK